MAHRLTVAVFDDAGWDADLQGLVAAAGYRVHVRGAASARHTSAGVLAELRCCDADVVVWDLSPALSLYCQVLELMLDGHAFGDRGVVVTTTSGQRVREYFGCRSGGLVILQRPCESAALCEALGRVAGQRPTRSHAPPA